MSSSCTSNTSSRSSRHQIVFVQLMFRSNTFSFNNNRKSFSNLFSIQEIDNQARVQRLRVMRSQILILKQQEEEIQLIKRLIELKAKQSTFAFIQHMSSLNDVIHNFEAIQSTSTQSINEFNTNFVAFAFNINFAFIEHMMSSRNDIHNFESIQRQFLCSMHVENALQHEINNDYFMR